MKVGVYARVSTVDKGQDTELQLRDLRVYVQARGFHVFSEYVDRGLSGSKKNRPELNRLMEDARKRRIDAVLVWRLDRFSRSLKDLINTLDELRALGVSFISYHENLDFTSSTGQLMFHLLGAFAEFERQLIRERVRAGLDNARAKGKVLGRPTKDIDVDELCRLKMEGFSIRKMSEATGLSVGLVHKTLSNMGREKTMNSTV